jgi:crotonobetainyl-CoA:carnitine CoA-transferase CaiB-like acyl-CoA transferase
VADHPHFDAVELVNHHDHPTEGAIRYVRDPFLIDGVRGSIQQSAPQLGQQSAEILAELGYDSDHIARLIGEG